MRSRSDRVPVAHPQRPACPQSKSLLLDPPGELLSIDDCRNVDPKGSQPVAGVRAKRQRRKLSMVLRVAPVLCVMLLGGASWDRKRLPGIAGQDPANEHNLPDMVAAVR